MYRKDIEQYSMTITSDVACESQASSSFVVALDPGICTFQTALTTEGQATFYGKQSRKKLLKLLERIDVLISENTKLAKNKKLSKKTRAMKIKNRKKKIG